MTEEIHEKAHPYLQTFIALTVLTLVEVGVSYAPDGGLITAVLLLLAVGKAALVGAVFMHIAYDKNPKMIVAFAFILPLIGGAILILSILNDWRT